MNLLDQQNKLMKSYNSLMTAILVLMIVVAILIYMVLAETVRLKKRGDFCDCQDWVAPVESIKF